MTIIEPPPHDGINVWMLSTARKCQLAGMPAFQAERQIMAFEAGARRRFKPGEVRRAIEKAYNTTLETSQVLARKPVKPKWEPRRTRATGYRSIPKGIAQVDLWESSPDRIDEGITQRMILDWLFPDPDALICVGKSAFDFYTARLNQFRDLTQCQFIVPCYMTAKHGKTQDGKQSMHCLDNTGPRRYCVCDFDEPASAEHPTIIWQLRRSFDLVMVLSSGGKSLHAWFNVPEDQEEEFWAAAIPMGADPALMRNRSSFVRIPEGTRDNGSRQRVIYFDQTKLPT